MSRPLCGQASWVSFCGIRARPGKAGATHGLCTRGRCSRCTCVDAQEDLNILGPIGEGAFGAVSLAHSPVFGKVATKWLKPGKVSGCRCNYTRCNALYYAAYAATARGQVYNARKTGPHA